MNKVFLIGRLTKDPELRYTNNNTPVATFTLAVNRPYTNQSGEREADFIRIVVWRKQAENVKNYLLQGSQAAVEGRLQIRNYDDNNGQKVYVTEVVADNVEFLGSKSSNSNGNNVPAGNTTKEPTPYDFGDDKGTSSTPNGTNVESNPFADFGTNIEISDDELPF